MPKRLRRVWKDEVQIEIEIVIIVQSMIHNNNTTVQIQLFDSFESLFRAILNFESVAIQQFFVEFCVAVNSAFEIKISRLEMKIEHTERLARHKR